MVAVVLVVGLALYGSITKRRKYKEHLVWTVGNGDPMHEVWIPHRIPRAWEQQG